MPSSFEVWVVWGCGMLSCTRCTVNKSKRYQAVADTGRKPRGRVGGWLGCKCDLASPLNRIHHTNQWT